MAAFLTITGFASIAYATPATISENHFGGSDDADRRDHLADQRRRLYHRRDRAGPFGKSQTNLLLVKVDWKGNQEWKKDIGGTLGYSVRQTSDGGYIATGSNGDNLYLAKTDASGNKQWDKDFVNASGGQSSGYSVQQTSDGGYIVAGEVAASSGDWNMYLLKTDASGNKQWESYYAPADAEVRTYSVWQTSDGGYIVGGHIKAGYNEKPVMVKADANGNIQWGKTYEGPGTWDNFASDMYGVQQTRDGGYIYAGANNRVMYLLKTDANGNKQWDHVMVWPTALPARTLSSKRGTTAMSSQDFTRNPTEPTMADSSPDRRERQSDMGENIYRHWICRWRIRSCRSETVHMRSQDGRRPITTATITSTCSCWIRI